MSFLDEILQMGVCDRYKGRLEACKSKYGVASMLDVNFCEWLASRNIENGLCQWVSENFGSFINGRFNRQSGGYSVSVWCPGGEPIELETAITCILGNGGTDVEVIVPEHSVRRVFVSGCRVSVNIPSGSVLYVDTDGSGSVESKEGVKVKTMRK